MPFPDHIDRILNAYGVPADTKSALYDLYVAMGDEVLEVFADLAESAASATMLRPEDTEPIRAAVVRRYLERNHARWLEGKPTKSLWHPREAEGRASGAAVPLGELSEQVRSVVGQGQSAPDGILVLGRNAHFGGRSETISFDVVARLPEDAIALGGAEGQQHTIPGSAGETSGTFDGIENVALLWEVQPNVYKPKGERNRQIAKLYRRHRNWHLVTLAAALEWLGMQKAAIFILRGAALATTHEVNPAKPVSETIVALHDRTVAEVVRPLGLTLSDPNEEDERMLLQSCVMNVALRKHVLANGAAGAIWKVA
jgi:hypothetical protein